MNPLGRRAVLVAAVFLVLGTGCGRARGGTQALLYDLANDPAEWCDLARRDPERFERMRSRLVLHGGWQGEAP